MNAPVADLLPWLNLLLLPALGLLSRISGQLATLEAVQREHARRLDRLEDSRPHFPQPNRSAQT